MLTEINGYVLSTKVAEYPQGVLSEFSETDYAEAQRASRPPQFQGEAYYHGHNNVFLGVEWQIMLSAIDGVICKISIRLKLVSKSCLGFLFLRHHSPSGVLNSNVTFRYCDHPTVTSLESYTSFGNGNHSAIVTLESNPARGDGRNPTIMPL